MARAAKDTIPFYAEGHDALLKSARALAAMADLPAHALEAAEEVIAEAEVCEQRRAEIDALRTEATKLLKERGEMEAALSEVPEDQLVPYTEGADYAAWSARCEAAEGRWQAMRDEPDTWNPPSRSSRGRQGGARSRHGSARGSARPRRGMG